MDIYIKRISLASCFLFAAVIAPAVLGANCQKDEAHNEQVLDAYAKVLRVTDPANTDRDIMTIKAVMNGNVEATRELLNRGFDPNTLFELSPSMRTSLLGIAASACQESA